MHSLPPLAQIGTATLAVAVLALTADRLGRWMLRGVAFDSAWERGATSLLLGLGLLGYLTLAAGLIGVLHAPLAVLVLAVGAALSARDVAIGLRRAARRFADLPPGGKALVVLAAAMLLLVYLVAVRPPIEWDATMYHLAYAKRYAATHHVAPVWALRFPVFPQLNDMLFTLAFLAGGEPAPALVELLLALATAAAVAAWGRRVWSPAVGAWAAAVWLGNPLVVFLATTAYIDVGVCAFATMAALALARYAADGPSAWLGISALAAGFAAGTKYLGLAVLGIVGLGVLGGAVRRRSIAPALGFAALALVAAAPFYLYNFIHTGDPLFPFGARVFGPGPWSETDLTLQLDEMRSHRTGRGLESLLLLPWKLTFAQQAFRPEAPMLPLFLPGLVVIAFAVRRDPRLRWPLGFVIAYGVFWFFGIDLLRYLVPASAVFALVLAASAARWARGRRAWVLAALLAAPGAGYAAYRLADGGVPVTAAGREAYLSAQLPGYSAFGYLNRGYGPRYHLYALGFERMFYFADGEMDGDWFGRGRYADVLALKDDPEALRRHLVALGADHLLMHIPGARRAADRPTLPAELVASSGFRERFEEVFADDEVRLFRLR